MEEDISDFPEFEESRDLLDQLVLIVVIGYGKAGSFEGDLLAVQQSGLALSIAGLLGSAAQFVPDDILVAVHLGLGPADRAHCAMQFEALDFPPQLVVLPVEETVLFLELFYFLSSGLGESVNL